MNVIICKNKNLKLKVESLLNNFEFFVLIKNYSFEEIKKSFYKFLNSNKKCFEDENIVIAYKDVVISKKENYINIMKNEPDCIKIKEKLSEYQNFIL